MTLSVTTRAFLVSLVALSTTSASPTPKYSRDLEHASETHNSVKLDGRNFFNSYSLSKRWDGSPAMGRELGSANSKACTLWPMMHLDDAKAGQMFSPPRLFAHSDYLQSDGRTSLKR